MTKIGQHHGFFWIKGKAGSGKSTIMKFAHRQLSKTAGSLPPSRVVGNEIVASPTVLEFFFTARGVSIERSTIGMYRSLLAPLLEKPLFLLHVLSVLPFPIAQLRDDYQWTVESLQELFKELIISAEAPVTCLVDALDECEEEEIRRMVYYLGQLGSLAMSNGIQFRVCFASRPYPHISMKRGLELILHEQGGHDQDIASYVRAELKIEQKDDADQIRLSLQRRSSGIFMWVVLVADILNRLYDRGQSREVIRRRLQEISNDLYQLLRDILTRDTRNKDQLASCIEWVLFATHPLSPEQLYFAVNTGTQPTESAEWDQPDVTYEKMRRFILNSSKGLVEITLADEPKIQFIHESVRDLFLKGSGRDLVWPDIGSDFQAQIHKRLYQRCLRYTSVGILLQPDVFDQSYTVLVCENPKFNIVSLSNFPFLDYAVHNMFIHAAGAEHLSTAGELVVIESFSCIKRFERFTVPVNVFCREELRRRSHDLSMVYTVADFTESAVLIFAHITVGDQDFLRVFVGDSEMDQLNRASNLGTPAFGPDLRYSKGERHVLSYLTEFGDKKLLMTMLDTRRFDVNSKDQDGNTPLFWAARSENEDIVNLLLDAGAEVNASCANFGNVLQFTIAGGLDRMVSLLLSRGADPHAQGGYYGNALQVAVVKSSEPIARLLLANGANVNAKGGAYANALYAASIGGQENLVKLLLDHGANINARGGHYGSALRVAVTHDHMEIVKLLKARGAILHR
jgi:hypothetical protein